MDYWAEVMQDDAYLIAADGWKAETYRIIEKDKKGKEKDKGWTCDLIPKELVIARFFAKEQAEIDRLNGELEAVSAKLAELEEEHGGDEGAFAELDKVNKANVTARLKEIKSDRTPPTRPPRSRHGWRRQKPKPRSRSRSGSLRPRSTPRHWRNTRNSPRPTSRRWPSMTNGWRRLKPTLAAKWIASVRRLRAGCGHWLNAMKRGCRTSPRALPISKQMSSNTSSAWGSHGDGSGTLDAPRNDARDGTWSASRRLEN